MGSREEIDGPYIIVVRCHMIMAQERDRERQVWEGDLEKGFKILWSSVLLIKEQDKFITNSQVPILPLSYTTDITLRKVHKPHASIIHWHLTLYNPTQWPDITIQNYCLTWVLWVRDSRSSLAEGFWLRVLREQNQNSAICRHHWGWRICLWNSSLSKLGRWHWLLGGKHILCQRRSP